MTQPVDSMPPSASNDTAELKVYSTIAVQSAVEALVPQFERASDCRLVLTWATADVLILYRAGIDTMREGAGSWPARR